MKRNITFNGKMNRRRNEKPFDAENMEPFDAEANGPQFTAPTSLLNAFEQILESSRGSELSADYLDAIQELTGYVSQKLDVTPVETVLLTIILEGRGRRHTDLDDIATHLRCSTIHMYSFIEDLKRLCEKKLICCFKDNRCNSDDVTYGVTKGAIEAIKADSAYQPQVVHCLCDSDFYTVLDSLYSQCDNDAISPEMLFSEIDTLFSENADLPIVKKLLTIKRKLSPENFNPFLLMTMFFVKDDDDMIHPSQCQFIFEEPMAFRRFAFDLNHGHSELLKKGFIEVSNKDNILMRNSYQVSTKVKRMLFANQRNSQNDDVKKMLDSYKEIHKKELFFNKKEGEMVNRLHDILDEKQYEGIRKRLQEKGKRPGICCLLYGLPGTGKTETVKQLARQSGRDIFQVNISQLRSKWVGESEKIVQQMFNDYARCVKHSTKTPILLINEADGLLTTRMKGAEHGADKSENTIQNIILQNMEDLDGILIATTNIADNLDPAFNRRFLYKVQLGKPCHEARTQIWKSMLTDLTDEDAKRLAQEFDFSGGQIENVARKMEIDDILMGASLTYERLRGYCQEEAIQKDGGKSIGFAK